MRLALAAALLLSTAPAFAVDAVTYKGKLGKYEILVELTDPGADIVAGRYSYMAKGGDIPLSDGKRMDDSIILSEEAPCTEETCAGDGFEVPIGATWTLTLDTEGALRGNWTPVGGGKVLDIALTEVGRRALSEDAEISAYGLYDSVFSLTYDGEFNAETTPYEFAKMDVALEEGPVEALEGSSFRYVTDPRTKFPFPRIVSLADGSSPDAANAALANRHARINYYAFDCLAQVYAGFGANQYSLGMGAGTLGDYDSEQVILDYLSPTVMNWVESGSTYCTGAHPNNHSDTTIVDVKTGQPFPLGKVFKDWIATGSIADYGSDVDQAAALEAPGEYFWAAGQSLIDYAIARWEPVADGTYEGCETEEYIASNLALRFMPGDQVLFTIEGLPHVSFACSEDLFTVKLSEIPELLTPEAKEYFPSLAD
jgi:hypothetical protein